MSEPRVPTQELRAARMKRPKPRPKNDTVSKKDGKTQPSQLLSLPTDLLVCICSFAISNVLDWALWQCVHPVAKNVMRRATLIAQLRLTVHKADIVRGFGPLASHLKHLNYPLPNFRLAADALAAGSSRLQGLSSLVGLRVLSCQGVTSCGQASLASLTGLRSLKLSHSIVGDELLSPLRALETLRLDTTNMSNLKLRSVASMHHLSVLELQYCNGVTDQGLAHLGALSSLRVLKLRYLTNVTNVGAASLGGLTELTCLDLTATRIDDECDFSPFKRLQKLILAQTDVTGANVPNFAHLQWLDMVGTKTGGVFWRRLHTFPALKDLLLSHTLITDADLGLAGLPLGLRALYVDACKLSGSGFVHPSLLEELHMSYCVANDGSLAFLQRFPNLRKLDLTANSELTSEGLCAMEHLGSITSLNLAECAKITHVRHLGSVSTLRRLDLSWCKNLVDARGVPPLWSLDLSNTALTNEGLPSWQTQRRLRHLRLTRTCIDDQGLKGIEVAERLERLDLHRTSVSDACVPTLSALPSLQSVDVSGTNITNVSPLTHVESVFHWYAPR